MIVPYCSECQRHASGETTRALAVALASGLIAATLAAVLPLLWAPLPVGLYVLLVTVGAVIPVGASVLRRREPKAGHSAAGRALWWASSSEVVCASPQWAAELARANSTASRTTTEAEPRLSRWMFAGLPVGLAAVWFFYTLHHPTVRVVNLTGEPMVLEIDGDEVVSLTATSSESSSAGVELRVAAGRRRLVARTAAGAPVESEAVVVDSGTAHLFAPGADEYCFWLETTGYGRASEGGREIRPLPAGRSFWRLPVEVDTWFAPNPPPSPGEARSSGGRMTALRQARCSEAPSAVRRAAGGFWDAADLHR